MICLPIRTTGFRDVIGFWKTIAISGPQYLARARRGQALKVLPLEPDLPGAQDRLGGQQSHDRATEDRLARA